MALLKTFLCLCNTRTGSLVSGCYTLIIALACLVNYLFRYVGQKRFEESGECKAIVYLGFVLYGFMIVFSLVIIPGVQLDKKQLLLPWIYVIILVVLYDTGSIALMTTLQLEQEKTLTAWEIVSVFFYLFRFVGNCYCFICVISQYQELSNGRGTYDYLYKPRRRASNWSSSFDIETLDLPFGVHLPPYTTRDTTENNPPIYSDLYPCQQDENCTSDIDTACVDVHTVNISHTSNALNPQISSHMYNGNDYGEIHANFLDRDSVMEGNNTDDSLPIGSGHQVHCSANHHGYHSTYSHFNNYNHLHYPYHLRDGHSASDVTNGNISVTHANKLQTNTSDSSTNTKYKRPYCYEITVNVEWI